MFGKSNAMSEHVLTCVLVIVNPEIIYYQLCKRENNINTLDNIY